MILVFGGTSETLPLAEMLAKSGYDVLVSTATNIALEVGNHPRIRRRCGRLDADRLIALLHREAIQAIVDAGHPYAIKLHDTVRKACRESGTPLLRFQRPRSVVSGMSGLHWAADHDEAALLACRMGQRVLLTVGSQHIAPYVLCARGLGTALYARVLPGPEFLASCLGAGLAPQQVITARGPFSIDDTRALLCKLHIQVLVTKESGVAGGFELKLQAAERENCRVVVIRRPTENSMDACGCIATVIAKLNAILNTYDGKFC